MDSLNCYIIQMGYLLFLWYIKKCIFLNVIVGTFYQYLPYFQNKNRKKKMQYENNLRNWWVFFSVKHKIWFSKSLFPNGTSGKRGGCLIFWSIGNRQKSSYIIQVMLKLFVTLIAIIHPACKHLSLHFLVYWSTHVWYVTGKHPYYVFKQIQQEQVFHCRRGGNISNFNSFLTQEIINVFSSCTAYSHRNCKHESRILAQVSRWHFGILWGF